MEKLLFENRQTSISGRITNVLAAYAAILICTFTFKYLLYLLSGSEVYTPYFKPPEALPFFFAIIFAPLWEELAFRHFPLLIAREFGDRYLLPVIGISSAIFGWGHGNGPISILFQGIGGVILSLVYIRNNFNYWSSVAVHAMYNVSVIYIFPYFYSPHSDPLEMIRGLFQYVK